MNIYAISDCPEKSARWMVDKHCCKMGTEAVQLLCTTFHKQGIKAPYLPTHHNHPNRLWVEKSYDNCQWLIEHAHVIFDEYTARYGRIHKSQAVLEWCEDNFHRLSFDSFDLTPFAVAIAEDKECRKLLHFESLSTIEKYKAYYYFDKQHIANWKRNKPDWYAPEYFVKN